MNTELVQSVQLKRTNLLCQVLVEIIEI